MPGEGQTLLRTKPRTFHDAVSPTMKPIRIATRNSPLALWQAEFVAGRLEMIGVAAELVPLVSGGDTDMRPIDGTRQVGLFTKRIQQAVLDNEADVAVHSLKDLPTETDERLLLAAVPERETVIDSLVSPNAWTLGELPPGSIIGTGSRRRAAQLLNRRPDLNIHPIRGNVQTRLSKLEAGEYDAIVLAEAGLLRLKLADVERTQFTISEMLPAPGQGALGIEVRSDDPESITAISRLNHPPTCTAVTAERHLLAALHGGCLAPIAAFAEVDQNQLRLTAVVLSADGSQRIDDSEARPADADDLLAGATAIAECVSDRLIQQGARKLIQQQRPT